MCVGDTTGGVHTGTSDIKVARLSVVARGQYTLPNDRVLNIEFAPPPPHEIESASIKERTVNDIRIVVYERRIR